METSGSTTTPIAVLVKEKLLTTLAHAEQVEVEDVSDHHCQGGAKLEVLVVSRDFDGLVPIKRHRIVNAALESEMSNNNIHALTIRAWTPQQYQAKQAKAKSEASG